MSGITLVTGGHGFLGSHLVEHLAARGEEVVVLDQGSRPPDMQTPGVHHLVADIRDGTTVNRIIDRGVSTIYHLAAMVGVDRYIQRPLEVLDTNVLGTRNVLRAAMRTGSRLVLASTSEVFGRNPAVPWTEEADRVLGSTRTSRWAYASSKAVAEHMLFAAVEQEGLPGTVIRYFNVYGPRQRPAYVISANIHRALNDLPPVRYDDGRQTRCFTYIDDAVRATALCGELPRAIGQSYNVGSSVETTVGEVLMLIDRITRDGREPVSLNTGERFGHSYEDVPHRVPDTSKARRELGWDTTVTLAEGLTRTVEWARGASWWHRAAVGD